MRNKNLILNPVFLLCVVILFCNDHFFKLHYTSWFTGKLSDVVGIILLPMLLTYLIPRLKYNSVFVAGAVFAFWKSPFSEPFIEFYNGITPIAIHRVVDYTDLLVLALLPVPYFLIKNEKYINTFSSKKLSPVIVLCPTIFILMSTSPPAAYRQYNRYSGNVKFENLSIEIKKTQAEIMEEFKKRNIDIRKDSARIISQSEYLILRVGRMNAQNLNHEGDIFKYNNDSLKTLLNQRIQESHDYKIDQMEIGSGSIVRNIQLSIWGDIGRAPKQYSRIIVHSIQVEKNLDSIQVDNKLNKIYKNLILQRLKEF
ncbi:hypothetical protein [Chryseobacterium sp. Mn2064]|uniref:hypothetical protein n=1 Tax=Chryseobacterium sp. Mn2064 TaxID=3395263 RepID=UPI003BE4ACEB